MTWFAVDDRFHSHRKVLRLRRSPHFVDAVALWTLAGSWACGQDREQHTGAIPVDVLASLGVAHWQQALDALVEVDLMACDGERAQFHDWATWNGPDAKHNRSREQTAQRQRVKRLRDCIAGLHSKDCPTQDLDGAPHVCPRRAERNSASRDADMPRKKPRNAASRDAGTGRDGTGRAEIATTEAVNEHDDTWPDVQPHLRSNARGVSS